MYLLRVVDLAPAAHPKANMPRVLLPAADPPHDAALAAVADPLLSQANVYLLRVVDREGMPPNANIPTVPGANTLPPLLHPTAFADIPPRLITLGIGLSSLKLCLGSKHVICRACCLHNCVGINIGAGSIASSRSRSALPLSCHARCCAINLHRGIVES